MKNASESFLERCITIHGSDAQSVSTVPKGEQVKMTTFLIQKTPPGARKISRPGRRWTSEARQLGDAWNSENKPRQDYFLDIFGSQENTTITVIIRYLFLACIGYVILYTNKKWTYKIKKYKTKNITIIITGWHVTLLFL